jgi:DNA-binding helix-turn-helix protein
MSVLWTDLKKQLFQNEALKLTFEANELKFKIIKNLLEYLKSNNMTQGQFAEKIGVKQQVISRFIKGEINPRFDFVAKILTLLDGNIFFQNEKNFSINKNTFFINQFDYRSIKVSGENEYESTRTEKKGA